MKLQIITLDKNNRRLRIGFGKHEGSWSLGTDIWYIGIRLSK